MPSLCLSAGVENQFDWGVIHGAESGNLQAGHKPGKHGKPRKLREFEKLSNSQGKLREI